MSAWYSTSRAPNYKNTSPVCKANLTLFGAPMKKATIFDPEYVNSYNEKAAKRQRKVLKAAARGATVEPEDLLDPEILKLRVRVNDPRPASSAGQRSQAAAPEDESELESELDQPVASEAVGFSTGAASEGEQQRSRRYRNKVWIDDVYSMVAAVIGGLDPAEEVDQTAVNDCIFLAQWFAFLPGSVTINGQKPKLWSKMRWLLKHKLAKSHLTALQKKFEVKMEEYRSQGSSAATVLELSMKMVTALKTYFDAADDNYMKGLNPLIQKVAPVVSTVHNKPQLKEKQNKKGSAASKGESVKALALGATEPLRRLAIYEAFEKEVAKRLTWGATVPELVAVGVTCLDDVFPMQFIDSCPKVLALHRRITQEDTAREQAAKEAADSRAKRHSEKAAKDAAEKAKKAAEGTAGTETQESTQKEGSQETGEESEEQKQYKMATETYNSHKPASENDGRMKMAAGLDAMIQVAPLVQLRARCMLQCTKTLGDAEDEADRHLKKKLVEPVNILHGKVQRISEMDVVIRATTPDQLPAYWERLFTGAERIADSMDGPGLVSEVAVGRELEWKERVERQADIMLDRVERKFLLRMQTSMLTAAGLGHLAGSGDDDDSDLEQELRRDAEIEQQGEADAEAQRQAGLAAVEWTPFNMILARLAMNDDGHASAYGDAALYVRSHICERINLTLNERAFLGVFGAKAPNPINKLLDAEEAEVDDFQPDENRDAIDLVPEGPGAGQVRFLQREKDSPVPRWNIMAECVDEIDSGPASMPHYPVGTFDGACDLYMAVKPIQVAKEKMFPGNLVPEAAAPPPEKGKGKGKGKAKAKAKPKPKARGKGTRKGGRGKSREGDAQATETETENADDRTRPPQPQGLILVPQSSLLLVPSPYAWSVKKIMKCPGDEESSSSDDEQQETGGPGDLVVVKRGPALLERRDSHFDGVFSGDDEGVTAVPAPGPFPFTDEPQGVSGSGLSGNLIDLLDDENKKRKEEKLVSLSQESLGSDAADDDLMKLLQAGDESKKKQEEVSLSQQSLGPDAADGERRKMGAAAEQERFKKEQRLAIQAAEEAAANEEKEKRRDDEPADDPYGGGDDDMGAGGGQRLGRVCVSGHGRRRGRPLW